VTLGRELENAPWSDDLRESALRRDRPVLKKPFPYEELVEVLTGLLSG